MEITIPSNTSAVSPTASPPASPPECATAQRPRRAHYRVAPKHNLAKSIFRFIDTNSCGYLGQDDLRLGLAESGVTVPSIGLKLFAALDTDGNGKVRAMALLLSIRVQLTV